MSPQSQTAIESTDGSAGESSVQPAAHPATRRYLAPGWFTRRVVNPAIGVLVRAGVNLRGARQLQVRGRSTGTWRTTPVNPLTLDGRSYLVAPRGETQWVRNLRVAGEGRLRRGRRIDEFTALEVCDFDKEPIMREYLRLWAWEVGQFFDGLSVDSSAEELAAAAPGFPVFEITVSG
jgi:deazaflavin-dependent oxidoreductase (nitroreductase family)